jgi:hypothetical protein
MQPVTVKPTNYTPKVEFLPSGCLSLKGRSLMLDARIFYDPLMEWIKQAGMDTVHFTIELDYFNTASAKKILEMLKMVDDDNKIQEFIVYWGFETDDEDILIKGQILENRLNKAKFHFIELAGV